MSFVSRNPATGKQICIQKLDTRADAEEKVGAVHAAFQEWRRVSFQERSSHLRDLAKLIRAEREKLAQLATAEMGKPITQARTEVERCATICEFYAVHAAQGLRDEHPAASPKNTRVAFEPLGVVLAIMPWNFPYWQAFRAAIPALAAGNAVLLKHAPNVSQCALAVDRLFQRTQMPANILRALFLENSEVGKLIADPRIIGVTLTGSSRAGAQVGALAGAAIKPMVVELGGSDPCLVLEDADIIRAAETCATSRLLNNGQSCVCAKRFIVVEKVRPEFEEQFVAQLARRSPGDPRQENCELGPLAREDLRENLHRQVAQSIRRGARCLLGGKIPSGPGYYYLPTALTDVRPGMPAYAEELFGPVAAIIPVPDEASAIRVANDSDYGLGAVIFTRSSRRARAIIPQIQAGAVFVNDYVRSEISLPFGGTKRSGFGRELGHWGLRSFVNVKTIWE